MYMTWTNNKTLLEYSKYTPCKDIFQAVCDEIGKYYTKRGHKYFPCCPKVVIENPHLKLEICFWSSKSNIPGEYVNLEIIPNFYSKQLKNKSNIKGFLFGYTELLYKKYTDDVTKIRINTIFGETIERTDEYSYESKIIDINNCNIYGLDEVKFNKIIHFIDSKIIIWFNKIQDKNGIIELLENAGQTRLNSLNGKKLNSDFIKYVKLNFPEINIERMTEQ